MEVVPEMLESKGARNEAKDLDCVKREAHQHEVQSRERKKRSGKKIAYRFGQGTRRWRESSAVVQFIKNNWSDLKGDSRRVVRSVCVNRRMRRPRSQRRSVILEE